MTFKTGTETEANGINNYDLTSGVFLTTKGLHGRNDNECRDQGHGSLRSKGQEHILAL